MGKCSIRSIFKVCLIYIFFSALWIAFSDEIIFWLISDPQLITKLQTYKGVAFIVVTSIMLCYLIGREMTMREGLEAEIKKKNEELGSINRNLRNEIEERKKIEKELVKFKKGLELSNKANSQLLANMSYEIRTPIKNIIGNTDMLNLTDPSVEQKKYLNMIETSSESMMGTIDDILDISKLEAGKIELEEEEFKLDELVQKCLESFELTTRRKGIKLSCNIDFDNTDSLVGDSGKLKQIIMNLLSNVVKLAPKGEINIKIEKIMEERDNILLKFVFGDMDTEIAFDAFSQADSPYSSKYGGVGLSLKISQKLVELMGGDMGFDTNAGQGSAFYFTVNLRLRNTLAEGYNHKKRELRGLRVLIADDDAKNRDILGGMFKEWGASITLAENGSHVNELLRESVRQDKKFDILLLDFYMPCINGVQCIEKVRKQPEHKDLTIMMVASVDSDDTVKLMKEIDDGLYSVKLVKGRELYDAVIRALLENKKKYQNGGKRRVVKRYSNKKVLVAEDNEINQKTVTIMLEAAGLYVDLASNGREAVQMFEEGSYDLILMDVQMPEMDGLKATAGIRLLSKGDSIPIIALTAHALKGDMEKCLKAGMNDYLSKPYTTKELYEKLEIYLGPALAV